jgi:hypothetical protein
MIKRRDDRSTLDLFDWEPPAATALLGFMPGLFGFVAVPERYAGIIEMHLLEEHEAEIAARKAALAAKWKAKR